MLSFIRSVCRRGARQWGMGTLHLKWFPASLATLLAPSFKPLRAVGRAWHDSAAWVSAGSRMVINELMPTPCWAIRRQQHLLDPRLGMISHVCAVRFCPISAPSASRLAHHALGPGADKRPGKLVSAPCWPGLWHLGFGGHCRPAGGLKS